MSWSAIIAMLLVTAVIYALIIPPAWRDCRQDHGPLFCIMAID